ncbi:MAG: heterodisulfide reductase-related iron-sulfur binding cluster [Syntrophobacterales bacterium]|nr:heterodisulfide reductase-related iron-sulfur binding cluster [Syntrophobacterales bacterium]
MKDPETIVRELIEECGDCDVCRNLMEGVCFFFPELYRLWDEKRERGVETKPSELRNLIENCHFCALCPCEPIRMKIIEAKTAYAERDGLSWAVKLVENVELLWGIFGRFLKPPFTTAPWLKNVLRIHKARKIPSFKRESFDIWAEKRGLREPPKGGKDLKVAYFVGCTGRFIFPEVPKSFAELMKKLGVWVYVFEQKCCGMPAFLEGDRRLTTSLLSYQVNRWFNLVNEGYEIVCSCPTCSFMMRKVITVGGIYDEKSRKNFGTEEVVNSLKSKTPASYDKWSILNEKLYGPSVSDKEYFSFLDPITCTILASHTFDAGEYILRIFESGHGDFRKRGEGNEYEGYVYFPSCHQREQKGELSYLRLFEILDLRDIAVFRNNFSCCGLGGIRGFFSTYHDKSMQLGRKLIDLIGKLKPRGIITECLSCRIQFEQISSYPVVHPLEVLNRLILG